MAGRGGRDHGASVHGEGLLRWRPGVEIPPRVGSPPPRAAPGRRPRARRAGVAGLPFGLLRVPDRGRARGGGGGRRGPGGARPAPPGALRVLREPSVPCKGTRAAAGGDRRSPVPGAAAAVGALPLAIFLLGVPLAVLALIVFREGMVLRQEPTAGGLALDGCANQSPPSPEPLCSRPPGE